MTQWPNLSTCASACIISFLWLNVHMWFSLWKHIYSLWHFFDHLQHVFDMLQMVVIHFYVTRPLPMTRRDRSGIHQSTLSCHWAIVLQEMVHDIMWTKWGEIHILKISFLKVLLHMPLHPHCPSIHEITVQKGFEFLSF